MFTNTLPRPSARENSGLPASAIVATTVLVLASITVALLPRPLKANTRCVVGSYRIASGPSPVGTLASTARLLRSNTLTTLACPQLMKPRFNSGASAMPCTPGVSGISPTLLPVPVSTTVT